MPFQHSETSHFQWILTGFVRICVDLCVWCGVSLCHWSIRKPHTFNGFSQDLCGFACVRCEVYASARHPGEKRKMGR